MLYLEMHLVMAKDFFIQVQSSRSSENGEGALLENSIQQAHFYTNPSLPRVRFEHVSVRKQMLEREVAKRS